MTENSLNSFSCTVSLEEISSTFTTELYGISYALKLMASVSRDVTIQIYTHSKTALQSIQKPRQQSGQDLLLQIYQTVRLLQDNGCIVKFYWIPCLEPFLGTKSAKSAAKRGTSIPLPNFKQDIARKTTLLTRAKRKLRAENPPLHPSVGKFTQSIDGAIPGNHTNMLYNQLGKEQARILAQLRTGKSRLNDYLSGIGGVESDQCTCGTGRETIRHFSFHCPKWTSHRQGIREKAAGRWGDLSYFLGGRSHARNRDGSTLLDKEPWRPNLETVRASVRFAQLTKRLNLSDAG